MITSKRSQFILFACLIVLISGCVSHVSPYIREPQSKPLPAQGPLDLRLTFIGDTGEPKPGEPVLAALQQWAGKDSKKTHIVFLGDNIYPDGMTVTDYQEAVRKLQPQLAAVRQSKAQAIFIPGNHDWARGGPQGAAATARQVAFIRDQARGVASMIPDDQCPGPEKIDFENGNSTVRLIVLDTQWWLNDPSYNTCHPSPQAVYAEIERLCDVDFPVIIATHHPVESMGPHGGFFDWRDHLFPLTRLDDRLWIPLPVIGSLYPLYRLSNPSIQDIEGPRYRDMKNRLLRIADRSRSPLFVFMSGHDHSLQVFQGEKRGRYRMVSGAGSAKKISAVGSKENTLFAHSASGFMSLDFRKSAAGSARTQAWLHVIEPNPQRSNQPGIVYSLLLNPAR